MFVVNVMLSRDLGGIQQAFANYSKMLAMRGFDYVDVVSYGADVVDLLPPRKNSNSLVRVTNFFMFDPISVARIILLLRGRDKVFFVCHGSRAVSLALLVRHVMDVFSDIEICVIGAAHNYWHRRILQCDYIFSITDDIKLHLVKNGYSDANVFLIPNCIELVDIDSYERSEAGVTIGAIGRFVEKKGFDTLIQAFAALPHNYANYQLLIAGDGEDKQRLKDLAIRLNISDKVKFIGWIHNKANFFSRLDICVIPSRHEPFGITILESLAHSVPVITTNTEGPREIFASPHNNGGIVVNIDDVASITQSIVSLTDVDRRRSYITSGLELLQAKYDISVVADLLKHALECVAIKH